MKKLLAALLALLMIATLAACSGDDKGEDDLDQYKQDEIVITYETIGDETFHFRSIDTETVAITAYEGSDVAHKLSIPTTLNGKTVVAIDEAAFYYSSKINALEIPETITTIGDYAFAGCVLLSKLEIPANVETIGDGAFYDCSGLLDVKFAADGKLTYIGKNAFNGCIGLIKLSIPASVKTVDDGAFMNCVEVADIVLAEGVETVGAVAFSNCKALKTLTLPASLANIGAYAFSGTEVLYVGGVTVPADSVAAEYVANVMKLKEAPIK